MVVSWWFHGGFMVVTPKTPRKVGGAATNTAMTDNTFSPEFSAESTATASSDLRPLAREEPDEKELKDFLETASHRRQVVGSSRHPFAARGNVPAEKNQNSLPIPLFSSRFAPKIA